MILSMLHWARWLAWFAGLASVSLLAMILISKSFPKGLSIWKTLYYDALPMVSRAIWFFIFLGAGWGLHDIWQFHNTYVIADLTVLKVVSPERFILSFDDTQQPFAATFCPNYLPPFEAGMKVKSMVYQDRGSCWDLSGSKRGYIFAKDSAGHILREAIQ